MEEAESYQFTGDGLRRKENAETQGAREKKALGMGHWQSQHG